ncbi:MAG TPA: response regulator [Polyangia bacterium]|jgi:CheY-like chemotaxis protein|nr:response regulator [Polyangia bacterium]
MPQSPSSAAAEPYVLVVDDEEGVRETLCDLIQLAGCRAVGAANGAEGMSLLRAARPCLIILDLLMPVMSGQEMLAAMHDQPDLASLPVVISTSAPSRAPKGLPVIAKPIDVNVMWEWIRRTCPCQGGIPAPRV